MHFGHFQFSSVTNSDALTFVIVSLYKRLGFPPRSQTSGSLSMGLFKLLAISGLGSKRSGPTQPREACFLSACSLVPGMFRRIHFFGTDDVKCRFPQPISYFHNQFRKREVKVKGALGWPWFTLLGRRKMSTGYSLGCPVMWNFILRLGCLRYGIHHWEPLSMLRRTKPYYVSCPLGWELSWVPRLRGCFMICQSDVPTHNMCGIWRMGAMWILVW